MRKPNDERMEQSKTLNKQIHNAAREVIEFTCIVEGLNTYATYKDEVLEISRTDFGIKIVRVDTHTTLYSSNEKDSLTIRAGQADEIWVAYLLELARVARHYTSEWEKVKNDGFASKIQAQDAARKTIMEIANTSDKPKVIPPAPSI